MRVTYFFRKRRSGFHSIENLFKAVVRHLPLEVEQHSVELPEAKASWYSILRNMFVAFRSRSGICHITGDIQYVASVLPRSRTVLTIHDVEILKREKGLKKALIKYLWFTFPSRCVRYITTISQFSKNELVQYASIAAEKIVVIPNCVEIDPAPQEYIPADKPVILHVGTKENKNLVRLAMALRGLEVKLLILGKPNLSQKNALAEAGVDYECFFDLKYDKVLDLYRRCTFFAFVSTYEGFGLPVLEAQSLGRAVLSSRVASIPEVAGDSALLVDPFDVAAIRSGVVALLENPSLRQELAKKGLENVKRFSAETIAQQYFDLYTKIEANCR